MHILYFLNSISTTGGTERIVIEKINHLVNLDGYQVTMAYFGSEQTKPFFQIDDRVKRKAVSSGYWGRSILKRLWRMFIIRKQVENLIKDVKPDIIVNASMPLVSWLLPFCKRNVPKIIEIHMSRIGKKILDKRIFGDRGLTNRLVDILRGCFYALYDKCVMLTDDCLHEWNLKNAIVIPNFTNLHFPDIDISKKEKIAINVGRLSYAKNHELLIDSWKIVHSKVPDWRLEIWGDGELNSYLANQVKSLKLDDVIFLKGVTKQIDKAYNRASFFILSSRYEGQPLVMIEALQAGLPCVCIAVNGVHGTIWDDYNGYIIEQATPEALADGILKMIHSDHRQEMSENARESAKAFNKDHVMGLWIALFDEMCYGHHQ